MDKKGLQTVALLLVMAGTAGGIGVYLGWLESRGARNLPTPLNREATPTTRLASDKQAQQTWMTIFVHGSFGTTMGFLSTPQVFSDSLKNSLYKKTVNRMRKDPFFYKDQPILQKGLVRVTPTFDPIDVNYQPLAVFPVVKSYELLSDLCHKHEHNLFYTFGWSGLVSQHRRRLEALRFYNALAEELERLRNQEIHPKIRVIAHSHGGNLCFNLAAVNKVLNMPTFFNQDTYTPTTDEQESLAKVFTLLKAMPSRELACHNKGLKQFDYIPTNKKLFIDELILFGTPIQPETASFCLSNTFKTIYNFYSESDIIQRFDFISTKASTSEQRLTYSSDNLCKALNIPHIIQAKIMLNRDWDLVTTATLNALKKIKDPSHKDLWFFAWKDTPKHAGIKPLPIVALTPIFLSLCEQLDGNAHDIDVNVKTTDKNLAIMVANHGETNSRYHQEIPQPFLDTIKAKLEPWKPIKRSMMDELGKIYQFLKNQA